jgi:hypothetical protein
MIITNKFNFPQAFVEMAKSEYEYKPKQYSVTSIIGGLRETMLKRRHHNEIEVDVSDMIWMLWGQAVHHVLEKQPEKDFELKEEYLKIDIFDGYKLSGRFDLYDNKHKKITDYKTASVWTVIYKNYDNYKMQLLMYAWMLREIDFPVDKGEIVLVLKDHSKSKAQRDRSYPQSPVHKVEFSFTEKDFTEIEEYIKDRFRQIQILETLTDNELPVCTPEERWHKDDTFAVMKKGRKSALRVLKSKEDAELWMGLNKGDSIEFRPGEDTKCKDYCLVNQFCNYYKEQREAVNE